jgi:Beta-L-arabinofuranosidase, GH127 catalytic domain/Beta-L-arabinofuranosidase, GH127 middle domain
MRKILLFILLKTFVFASVSAQTGKKSSSDQIFHLAPLAYKEIPLGAIRPTGWLYHQLEIMSKGSTGHLDEYYPKLKDDNGWLGGKGDGWEETPYWLDGALPLAYLLKDSTLINKVLKYVNWTLDHQRPSGFFGPITKKEREGQSTSEGCTNGDDWWPRMIMLKVIQQYYSATGDKRVIPFMTKYFRYELRNLPKCKLDFWSGWGRARGGDNLLMVYWLYRITHDPFLLKLGNLIYQQTTPWTNLLGGRNWVMQAAAQQNGTNWMDRHGVNVAMGLKLPAVYYEETKDRFYLDSLKTGWNDIMLLHGLPNGMFSADEDLHGNAPSQGTELCAVVETMFSLEEILGITGDLHYADAAERIAFNILPGQTTDDYDSRQYFQMANQVDIQRGVYDFTEPFSQGMNNVFGLYAGYTCCTANMHQGWTKFTEHLWYKTPSNGLAALLYSPNTVSAKVGMHNAPVKIDEETNYPFGCSVNFIISTAAPVLFPLQLRIPSWCDSATIMINREIYTNATGGSLVILNKAWHNGDRVKLILPMKVFTSNWAKNSRAIEKGPLVYALKIKEDWERDTLFQSNGKSQVYFNVVPASTWNYGLLEKIVEDPGGELKVIQQPFDPDTFEWNPKHSPIEIIAPGKEIPEWKSANGVPLLPVTTRDGIYEGKVDDNIHELTLLPYGCLKLRIVAFPVVN